MTRTQYYENEQHFALQVAEGIIDLSPTHNIYPLPPAASRSHERERTDQAHRDDAWTHDANGARGHVQLRA